MSKKLFYQNKADSTLKIQHSMQSKDNNNKIDNKHFPVMRNDKLYEEEKYKVSFKERENTK